MPYPSKTVLMIKRVNGFTKSFINLNPIISDNTFKDIDPSIKIVK